jgi:hypothetical protein
MALWLVVAAKSLLNAKKSVWLMALKFVKSAACTVVVNAQALPMANKAGNKRLEMFMRRMFLFLTLSIFA